MPLTWERKHTLAHLVYICDFSLSFAFFLSFSLSLSAHTFSFGFLFLFLWMFSLSLSFTISLSLWVSLLFCLALWPPPFPPWVVCLYLRLAFCLYFTAQLQAFWLLSVLSLSKYMYVCMYLCIYVSIYARAWPGALPKRTASRACVHLRNCVRSALCRRDYQGKTPWVDSTCAKTVLVFCSRVLLVRPGSQASSRSLRFSTRLMAPCGWEFNRGRGRGWESRSLSRFCFALIFKGFGTL